MKMTSIIPSQWRLMPLAAVHFCPANHSQHRNVFGALIRLGSNPLKKRERNFRSDKP
jgi:hypothetical protein